MSDYCQIDNERARRTTCVFEKCCYKREKAFKTRILGRLYECLSVPISAEYRLMMILSVGNVPNIQMLTIMTLCWGSCKSSFNCSRSCWRSGIILGSWDRTGHYKFQMRRVSARFVPQILTDETGPCWNQTEIVCHCQRHFKHFPKFKTTFIVRPALHPRKKVSGGFPEMEKTEGMVYREKMGLHWEEHVITWCTMTINML